MCSLFRLRGCRWNYMNDSLRTDVFVKYQPETIACACIYLSARQLHVILPSNPPWFGLVGADEDELKEISRTILRLYSRPRKSYEELDRVVERCRLAMQEAKIAKLKGDKLEPNSTGGTPNNFSPHSSRQTSPKVNSESPNLPSSYKTHRVKDEPTSGGSGQSSHKERNGKVGRRSKSGMSNSRSHSKSPRHGGRSNAHSSASDSSRSRSHSPHNDKHYKHKKKDDHKRSRRDRERDRSRDRDRKYPKVKSRSHKRKHSRSSSRDSRSRSRSRSPIRRNKYDAQDSPSRESKSKDKHRRQRSRSRERSRKTSKRDSSGHRRSRDRRRR